MRRDIGEQWSASSACGWVLSLARLLHSLLPYNWGGLLLFETQTFWCRRLFFLLLLLRFFVPAADCCSPWNCSVTYPVSCWSWLTWQTAAESSPLLLEEDLYVGGWAEQHTTRHSNKEEWSPCHASYQQETARRSAHSRIPLSPLLLFFSPIPCAPLFLVPLSLLPMASNTWWSIHACGE
jgi:hypothetical protein